MVGVGVCTDQMIDPVNLVGVEIRDDAAAVLSPITCIDEDRFTVGCEEMPRISLSNVDVMNFEFAVAFDRRLGICV